VSQAVLLGGHWKGIREKRVSAPIQLYDLANDLAEKTDVAVQHADLIVRIAGLMRTAHVDNEYWKIPGLAEATAPAAAR
jgi:hypothetical protein